MLYRVLTDVVVFFHFAFVLFVIAGGLIALKWPHAAWLHLPAAAWGALIEFAGWICPLTPLENRLRKQTGKPVYSSGFIDHYLVPLIYPDELTRSMQITLGGIVVMVNLCIYASLLIRWRRTLSRRI